jgi:hypothetical protein
MEPNREACKLVTEVSTDMKFFFLYAPEVFEKNNLEYKDKLKEVTSDLIRELKKASDLIPK